ncbi:Serine/threonine-protein kinase STE11 [Leucoagaricus sp. SymC.cos]|nr:Serine/threonine-protein kinase STE11 [Leucoagaricus sp. SymC.cos]
MSALAAANASYGLDSSQTPPKPASPVTPTSTQPTGGRSFINLNPEVRGHHAPFPLTPTTATIAPSVSLEPPLGMSFADYLKSWNDAQTARWLAECKCVHHADAFKANDIRGDILLELDQATLRELGITSIGDRLRMLNAVRNLRQRASNRFPGAAQTRHPEPRASTPPKSDPAVATPRPHNRRPAPLRLNGTHGQNDLPTVLREQPPDSARNVGSHARSQLPPLPPPRGQPPPVPAARPANRQGPNWATTPTTEAPPSYTTGSLPPAPQQQSQLLTPSYHSPPDSRPGNNTGSKNSSRSTSPLPGRGVRPSPINPVHGRNGSGSLVSPSTASNSLNKLPPRPSTTGTSVPHPFANPQATAALQPPIGYPSHNLSPIDERSFDTAQQLSLNNVPFPTSHHPSARGPFHSNGGSTGGGQPLTLDEIRRKLVKFVLPDEGLTYTIDVASCNGGIEVLEKVLKKFGKGGSKAVEGDAPLEHVLTVQGGLTVDGWGVYLDFGQQDGPGEPLTEAELMSICHAPPDHPTREHGLVLRRTRIPRRTDSPSRLNPPSNKTTKRASSISILSSLGVRDPEQALDPPSPTSASGRLSPAALNATAKRPSKLRHFFGQRPPSELITNHLPEYFPNTEKKILERTARHSMMLKARRESFASVSNQPLPSRMSLSTEDGRSIDLHSDDSVSVLGMSSSTSIRRMSRTTSTSSSRRMSYMTELRSKRDRSDTASVMTVDQITAEVESRRASSMLDGHGSTVVGGGDDDWTEVDAVDQGVTLNGEDDDIPKASKWIKGALIGAGSFGKVYLGMDASNGLLMAVKQVELPTGSLPNQERKKSMLNALEREIELLKNLQHENIVQYLYSSVDEEYLNIFLEYVPGGSVATLLRNYGAFEEPLVKNFVRQILSGLSYLHERDIIHRDIKGANILVDNKGGVKISDFGISKKVNDNLLANKMHRFSLQGSVFWMAPEVVKQSGHTLKADIWSVGCLVVEMLTGEHPWAQLTQMQAIFKIGSSAKPAIPSDISAEAADFLAFTFELDQNARPSAQALSQHPFLRK